MKVSQKQMLDYFLPVFKKRGQKYQKSSLIRAKLAIEGETVITKTSDGVETKNTAKKGDYLVENQTSTGELYIVRKDVFEKKYEMKCSLGEGWASYQTLKSIWATQVLEEDLKHFGVSGSLSFEAPWGEEMIVKTGDFLVSPEEENEIYRIAKKEFGETYKPIKA